MQPRAIARILIDSAGRLFVAPDSEPTESYEYIYREANGLRWDRGMKALFAYEPTRWKHEELLQHIDATLRSCCDEVLCFTERTEWVGVSPALQGTLRSALSGGAHERDA
jgi:hypothetical protein